MARKHDDGGTPATAALRQAGVDHVPRRYRPDPRAESWGLDAARALDVDPDRVFKTLVAQLDPSTGRGRRGQLVVGVVPVSRQLDLKALARALSGRKAVMAEVVAAERATGYVAGGISPIGQRRRHRTVVDESALRWPSILVSGGRRGLDLELAPDDLVRVTAALTADIGR